MSNEQEKILRAKVNMETSRIAWKELQKFFAGGSAVEVSPELDLIEVAYQMHSDNKIQFKQWLEHGLVEKVSDEKDKDCFMGLDIAEGFEEPLEALFNVMGFFRNAINLMDILCKRHRKRNPPNSCDHKGDFGCCEASKG